jgi:diaminopimelate epimerase
MKPDILFSKMHGAGNDFILIDNRSNNIQPDDNSLIKRLCDRRLGIGADGLMLIDYQNPARFRLIYFNADGETAEMCGNGARCAVFFMHLAKPKLSDFEFSVGNNEYSGSVTGKNKVRVTWNKAPRIIKQDGLAKIILPAYEQFAFVNSGVPHLILQVKNNLDELDIRKWGPYYRQHSFFQPAGTNVDFIKITDNNIHIRTFERGVEGETLSCGTGALAAAAAAINWGYLKSSVHIISRGGNLQVGLSENGKYWLEGPVQKVFDGKINKDDF